VPQVNTLRRPALLVGESKEIVNDEPSELNTADTSLGRGGGEFLATIVIVFPLEKMIPPLLLLPATYSS